MKALMNIILIFAIFSCGKINDKKVIEYKSLHKKLTENDDYLSFKGFRITPRNNGDDVYSFRINKLSITLFLKYESDTVLFNEYSVKLLNEFLSKDKSNEYDFKDITHKAYDLITIMKQNNLRAVNSVKLPADSTKSFIDFQIDKNNSLRFGDCLGNVLTTDKKNVTKIDSLWIYIKYFHN